MAKCTPYNIMYVIKFVSDLQQIVIDGVPVSSTNKTDRHNITEILLKVALNTINQTINVTNQLYDCTVFRYLSPNFHFSMKKK